MQVELRVVVDISDDQAVVLDDVMTKGFQEKLTRKMGNFLHQKLNKKLLKNQLCKN